MFRVLHQVGPLSTALGIPYVYCLYGNMASSLVSFYNFRNIIIPAASVEKEKNKYTGVQTKISTYIDKR